jgi:hypothetical protein
LVSRRLTQSGRVPATLSLLSPAEFPAGSGVIRIDGVPLPRVGAMWDQIGYAVIVVVAAAILIFAISIATHLWS